MTVERTAEGERALSDATIAVFVAEHYDRLLRLARLVDGSTWYEIEGSFAGWLEVAP